MEKPTVAWITDQPGWAYDNRAQTLSRLMPGYEHRTVCYSHVGFAGVQGADVIVCPDPRILPCFQDRENVVLHVNAIKIFAVT